MKKLILTTAAILALSVPAMAWDGLGWDNAAGGSASVEDDAYGAGWNGDTANAPSQNSVYDKINAMPATAGDHVTLTGTDIDLDTEISTDNRCAYIETPAVEDMDNMWQVPVAVTVTRVWCITDAGTTTLNIENDSDTDILSADIVCDVGEQTSCASGCDVDTIQLAQDNIAQYGKMNVSISATATATVTTVCVHYTIDD